jgi:hypothetical protein
VGSSARSFRPIIVALYALGIGLFHILGGLGAGRRPQLATRQVIRPQARWSIARFVSARFLPAVRIRRKHSSQEWKR